MLERLDVLRTPIVMLASKEDGTAFPDQLEAGLSRTPHALMSLLEGGHYPWIDAVDPFLDVLHEILEQPDR